MISGTEEKEKYNKHPMVIWEQVSTTDPKFTKEASFGHKFTSIDQQYQLEQATKLWGPYGSWWGLEDMKWDRFEVPAVDRSDRDSPVEVMQTQMMLTATLFYPGGAIEQSVDMPFKAGQDTCKKMITSLRSKALSCLGFSADVFMGKHEDAAYVTMAKVRFSDQQQFLNQAKAKIKLSKTGDDLKRQVEKVTAWIADDTITAEVGAELLEEINDRAEEIS